MKEPQSSNGLLWIVAAGLFMQTLDTTIVNTALPSIAASLNCTPVSLHTIIIAYSLTLAIFTPVSGWLADLIGTRRVFVAAVLVFVLGSVACALSASLGQLIGARVVQGVGGSMLMPVGRLALLRAFSRERYLSALGFVTIAAQVAPLVGPTLGGWLVQTASWPWIFLINVPIGFVGMAAAWRMMPRGLPDHAVGRLDLRGFLLLATAMAAFFLGLEPPHTGVNRAVWAASLLGASALAVAVYLRHAARAAAPLVSLELFDDLAFRIGLFGNLVSRIGSSAVPFLLPLLFQLGLGYSPFTAGLLLVPGAISGVICKPFVAPLVARHGYVRFLLVNTVVLGVSIIGFSLMGPGWPLAASVVQLAVFGAVNSMQFAAMSSVTLKDLDARQISSGNSLFSMVQMLAMALGVAVAGGLLPLLSLWSGLAHGVLPGSAHVSADGFRLTFWCVGAITLASGFCFSGLRRTSAVEDADLPSGGAKRRVDVYKQDSVT